MFTQTEVTAEGREAGNGSDLHGITPTREKGGKGGGHGEERVGGRGEERDR